MNSWDTKWWNHVISKDIAKKHWSKILSGEEAAKPVTTDRDCVSIVVSETTRFLLSSSVVVTKTGILRQSIIFS